MTDDATDAEVLVLKVPETLAGERVDKALSQLLPEHSRSSIQRWLKELRVTVDGEAPGPRQKLRGLEQIVIKVPALLDETLEPEAVDFELLYEDEVVLVINKPPGLVVHPGAGNESGTLANGLVNFDVRQSALPRGGIVHRLDKDTSGLMMVARTEAARLVLIDQLASRSVSRQYQTVVGGEVISGGSVDEPIGRDPHDRRRMAVVASGKHAVSHYRVSERFRQHTLLDVQLETGRTHQIRVHLAFAGFAVFGDPLYGRRLALPPGATDAFAKMLASFKRQALHAVRLRFEHPSSGEEVSFEAPPPNDMLELCSRLREDAVAHGIS